MRYLNHAAPETIELLLDRGAQIVNYTIDQNGNRDYSFSTLEIALRSRAATETINLLLAAGSDPEQLPSSNNREKNTRNALIERRNTIVANRDAEISEVTNRLTEVGAALAQGLYKETFQSEEFRNRVEDQVSLRQERIMEAISILERLTSELVSNVASYLINNRAFSVARLLPPSIIRSWSQNQISSPFDSYFLRRDQQLQFLREGHSAFATEGASASASSASAEEPIINPNNSSTNLADPENHQLEQIVTQAITIIEETAQNLLEELATNPNSNPVNATEQAS